MSATMKMRPRSLTLLWTTVLAGPIAWSLSLAIMFWTTRSVCHGGSRNSLLTVGIICALLSIAGGILAARGFKQPLARFEFSHFMLGLAVGASAVFALVIVLSLVPIFLLSPCGV
jgi:hypothetical protein